MRPTAPDHPHAARLLAATLLVGAALACPLAVLADPPAAASQTRILPWTGGDRLSVDVAADVDYIPGPNARVVITGPADEIRDIVVDGGEIRDQQTTGWRWFGRWGPQDWPDAGAQRVKIVVTAPHLSTVAVHGSGHLNLGRLAQDRLDLTVSGSGVASASGAIASLRLSVSGAGHADMAGLDLQDVTAGLSGSGSASVAPRRSADLGVSGSGHIRLLTSPARLTTRHSGSGRIIRPDGGDA